MFNLVFSEKINKDIISTLKYINEVLGAPRAAEVHYIDFYIAKEIG